MSDSPLPADFKAFLAWSEQAVEESDAFLRSQRGYDQFQSAIDAIDGELKDDIAVQSLGGVTYNHFGKVATEMAATQTDIKPFWDYTTKNHLYDRQVEIGNKLAAAWWMGRHVSTEFSSIIKYCLPMGTGYAHQVYNSENNGFGGGYQGGDIEMLAEDPRDVLPVRPGSFKSIQEAAGVIIRRERTVNWIKAKHGDAAATVRADREGSIAQLNKNTRYGRLMSQLGLRSGFMENLISSLGITRTQAASLQIPSADYYTLYINDYSVNTAREGTWMGLNQRGERTNWSYYVPAIGELYRGQVARDTGDYDSPVRLYPRKRQVIFTRTCRIYDNTSIYWHGMFPLCKLTLDPWPWSWLGKAPLKDLLPLHAEMQKVMKVMSRHVDRIKRPGIAADKNALSEKALKSIDPEQPGLKARLNPVNGKPLEMLYEPALDGFVLQYFGLLRDGMSDLSGMSGVQQMIAELNQIPQMETVDKLIALGGVINTLRSLVIEAFMAEFAMMLLMNFFQFYTREQRIAILGPQGQTFEDFDFDPGNLIPHDVLPPLPDGSPAPRGERAREFFRYFTWQAAPGSMLRSADLPEQMKYIQLARAGVIDLITLLEKLNIPNIGVPADMPSGIIPRLQWQQANNIGMAQNPAGRKASGQSSPRLKVSESG